MTSLKSDNINLNEAFAEWQDTNTLTENLFVWQFFLADGAFPGWQSITIQTLPAAESPTILSVWQRPEVGRGILLNVDVFACSSRSAAHEYLRQLLQQIPQPVFSRQTEPGIGDVLFAPPDHSTLLFARANLVLIVRNAGSEPQPITDIARQLDEDISSRPETGGQVVPEFQRFETPVTDIRVGTGVPLQVEATDPLERLLWFKFFSASGQVFEQEGQLWYRPTTTGPQEITALAINANRGIAGQVLQLNVT